MKIEDEIKQKKFRSEYHKLLINLIFTTNWLNNMQQRFFKPYGITAQQYNVLRILKGQYPGPASVGMVQERMLDRSSNITRLVDKLIEKKLVSRCENPQNRRMQELRITEKGISFVDEIMNQQNDEQFFSKITEEEARKMNETLDNMRE
jgi:DNA-binding MarR family transcriptional regulator